MGGISKFMAFKRSSSIQKIKVSNASRRDSPRRHVSWSDQHHWDVQQRKRIQELRHRQATGRRSNASSKTTRPSRRDSPISRKPKRRVTWDVQPRRSQGTGRRSSAHQRAMNAPTTLGKYLKVKNREPTPRELNLAVRHMPGISETNKDKLWDMRRLDHETRKSFWQRVGYKLNKLGKSYYRATAAELDSAITPLALVPLSEIRLK